MGAGFLNNSLASNPVVGLRGGFNDRQNLVGVKAKGARQNDQLDNVDPALTAFKAGNEGLVTSEPVCQVFLTKARFDTGVDQRLAQCLLSFASDSFCHASHTFCDVASGRNLLSKKWILEGVIGVWFPWAASLMLPRLLINPLPIAGTGHSPR